MRDGPDSVARQPTTFNTLSAEVSQPSTLDLEVQGSQQGKAHNSQQLLR
jgi:hypothetical protein